MRTAVPGKPELAERTLETMAPVELPAQPQRPRAGAARKIFRLILWPVLRVLEPRFADTNRRLEATHRSLHEESAHTRDVFELEIRRLEASLDAFGVAGREVMSFVGVELRSLRDEMQAMSESIAELRARLDQLS